MRLRSCSVKLYIKNVPDADMRDPKVTRSLIIQQPAELLPTEANDKRSHPQHMGYCIMLLLSSQGSTLGSAWRA